MKLQNTLTNSIDDVTPSRGNVITFYSCGPTVYGRAQIGNLRTFISDDVLRRVINYSDYELQAVMNLTDIDDKTIAKSRTEHADLSAMEALIASTRHYEALFIDDLEALGVDTSLVTFVRATDSIEQMQTMIAAIDKRGYAYISEGSVYFNLAKYRADGHRYGQLINVEYSGQARIDNDEYDKNEARDFVLWKAAKDDEPFWDLELNGQKLPGRPGWHIECSAMATNNLGQPISLHSGGIDLKFPHHENEIAQVMGANGEVFTKVFTHHNHLLIDGRRMGKSLNNFYTLSDIIDRGYNPLVYRLLVMQAAHTSELNFTWESLAAAQSSLLNLYAWADRTHQDEATLDADAAQPVFETLNNDLDTPAALAKLYGYSGQIPSYELLKALDALLGLQLSTRSDITAEDKALIEQRQTARQNKDFAAADALRDKLTERDLEIDDTPNGPRWRRTTI